MRWRHASSVAVSLAIATVTASLGAQSVPTPAKGIEHVCSILSKAEVAKYIARGRDSYTDPSELPGICAYGASWAQVLVYSGPNAEERFNGLLKSFKKDKEPRYPLASLGTDGWVMYPRPDNQYQSIGAFTHTRVGTHVVSVFIDADDGKPAESAKGTAETVTKLVMSRLP